MFRSQGWAMLFATAIASVLSVNGTAEVPFKPHIEHAKAALLKKDLTKAGGELRAAADYLWKAGASSPGAAKEGLESAAKEMSILAEDVRNGTVTDVKRIDDASSRAYRALANERFVTAIEAWGRHDAKATGHALRDAAGHLEDGSAVAGHESAVAQRPATPLSRASATTRTGACCGPEPSRAPSFFLSLWLRPCFDPPPFHLAAPRCSAPRNACARDSCGAQGSV